MATGLLPEQEIEYPASDGEPMADNTLQLRWIFKLYAGIEHAFAKDPNVFVAADLLWISNKGTTRAGSLPT